MRILLAEDDELLGSGIRAGLTQHGFQVDWVRDGIAAARELSTGAYQACVLDLGLPRQDGMDVLQQLRTRRVATPVLVLTARDAVSARIAGLDAGADDYLIKPVDLHELAARLRALVRRAHGQSANRLCAGTVELDSAAHQVWCEGVLVDLSQREYDLLHALLLNAGRVLNREQLEQHLYQWGNEINSNAVEVHIYHLRRKLGAGLIETVRGVGYRIARTPA
ncbi:MULTISPECIES: response regulator [Giesbergeria]|uniref:Response regulator n=1 Tax=Giesbergeria sinuosa TaxID=80883 RepID=A0ABV9Q9Q7_9BURK